jgi:hypothetical protein
MDPHDDTLADHSAATRTPPLAVLNDDRRINDRLPSLVHELLYYRMVERTEAGTWVLRPELEAALEAQHLATVPATGHRVFVGLRCEVCSRRTVTSMVEGRRLCQSCATADPTAGPPATDVTEAPTGSGRRRRSGHLRRAG